MGGILELVVKGADFSGTGLGKYSKLPALGGALYAGWMLGTEYGADPLADLSNNGRALTKVGVGPGEKALVSSATNYLLTPFTQTQLLAVSGACTLISVNQVNAAQAAALVAAFRLSPASNGLGLMAGSATTNIVRGVDYSTGAQLDLPSANARGAEFEFHASTFSPTGRRVYRRRASFSVAETATDTTAIASVSASPFAIGYMPGGGGYTAVGQHALVLVASKALSLAELDEAYIAVRALLAGHVSI